MPGKKPKDPHAPKRPCSSYFLYSNERRPLLKQSTGKPITEISKIIAAEWKAMDADSKKKYETQAKSDKARYQEQLAEYQKTDNFKEHERKLAEWKASGGNRKGGKGKPPKKPKQPADMPKRPQTAYFLFSNKRRGELKTTMPDKKITELSKIIAAEWKTIDAGEKAELEKLAGENKEKYKIEIEKYKQTQSYSNYEAELSEWKMAKKRFETSGGDDSDDEPKVSLPRKPKDANCPKRPLSSYFLYANSVREATKTEHPTLPITKIAKEISKKWKLLSTEEKQPFDQEAAQLKEQYKKDIAEYEGSESQLQFKKKLEEWKKECNRRKTEAKQKSLRKRAALAKKKASAKKKKATSGRKRRNKMDVDSSSSEESSSDDSDSDSDSDDSSSEESSSEESSD